MNSSYNLQVSLLLRILPEIAREKGLALHGGTAINLFHRNMPRLSVDIDLTFIPFTESRENDLKSIRTSLLRIKEHLNRTIPGIHFDDEVRTTEELKIVCSLNTATVKIEVNQINRGIIGPPEMLILCEKAQTTFNTFCEIQLVPTSQLWGGKIIAALDRQHPRDLFDIQGLLNNVGYTEEIHAGFIFFLLCSKRPLHEILQPSLIDQSAIILNQFSGMTDQPFAYAEFERTRDDLIRIVNDSLTLPEKKFLTDFASGNPVWSLADYSSFPGIKWKLININRLKKTNKEKFIEQSELLNKILYKNKL